VNWIDLTLLTVLGLFGIRGYFRGLFREVFSVLGLVTGFMLAVRYDDPAASLVQSYWLFPPFLLKAAVFIAIFFVTYFAFALTGWLLNHSDRALFLRTVNRFGGLAVGVAKGAAITALIVSSLASSAWVPRNTRENIERASLVSPLSRLGAGLIWLTKEKLLPRDLTEA
jgi:membrane protein required for colicin V production